MKIKLDENIRKFIEVTIEINEESHILKYFEKNTRQIKEIKNISKDKTTAFAKIDELSMTQFLENLQGDKDAIDAIMDFYEENGNVYDFINKCDEALGKLKKRG